MFWCGDIDLPDLLRSLAHNLAPHAVHGSISAHTSDVIPRVPSCLLSQQLKVHLWLHLYTLHFIKFVLHFIKVCLYLAVWGFGASCDSSDILA